MAVAEKQGDGIYTVILKHLETQETEKHHIKANDPDGALHKLRDMFDNEDRSLEVFKVLTVAEI